MYNILIGYVYNNNGMCTWCIEASRALQLQGHHVLLTVSPYGAQFIPDDVPFVIVDDKRKLTSTFFQKIIRRVKKYSVNIIIPDWFNSMSETIVSDAGRKGFMADIIFWNQTNLLSQRIQIPQWVVGWAYPAGIAGYLNKLKIPGNGSNFNRILDLWYWYRIDNMAYRRAAGVLTVTKVLTEALAPKVKNVVYAAPSCGAKDIMQYQKSGPITLCISALGLEDKRKNIAWMIESLAAHSDCKNCTIHLIGQVSETFKEKTKALLKNAVFHGYLPREKAMELLSASDVMLFGSLQDDWGYVQIEAMSSGLVVVAPDQIPCCEIIPDKNCLYPVGNKTEFANKVALLVNHTYATRKTGNEFYAYWLEHFSRKPFGAALQRAIESSLLISN